MLNVQILRIPYQVILYHLIWQLPNNLGKYIKTNQKQQMQKVTVAINAESNSYNVSSN